MNIVFKLLPISLALAALFVLGFIWMVRSGQYEDTQTPPIRMLFDDEPKKKDQPPG